MKTVLAVIIILVIILASAIIIAKNFKTEGYVFDTGNFTLIYDNATTASRYEYYASLACYSWNQVMTIPHKIRVNINEVSLESSVIAQAVPTQQNDAYLTTAGYININRRTFFNQSTSGRIFALKHELGHILGLGYTSGDNPNRWNYENGFLVTSVDTVLDKYNSLGGITQDKVPVENTDEPAHWENDDRDAYPGMPNELMIARLSGSGFISEVSLAFLEGLGFEVDYAKAEGNPFSLGLNRDFTLGDDTPKHFNCGGDGRMKFD